MAPATEPASLTPVEADLLAYAGGQGHPEFPCLSRAYGPSSCVPCKDFSPWLRNRVLRGDWVATGEYLWCIRQPNPGVAGPADVARRHYFEVARRILYAPLERHLGGGTQGAYLELRVALVILAAHEVFSGFVMTGEAADYLAAVMLPHTFVLVGVDWLVARRNSFVADMGREMSYWAGWPVLAPEALLPPALSGEPELACLRERLADLPLGTRAHAVDALRQLVADPEVPRPLAGLSRYETRKRGLEVAESARRIVACGLVGPASDVAGWLRGWTRRELLGFLAHAGVGARNSWSKERLAATAVAQCREALAARMAESGAVQLIPSLVEGAQRLRAWFENVRETWRVWLAFGTGI